jgi:guanine nucleotide-binding protein subunit alpha
MPLEAKSVDVCVFCVHVCAYMICICIAGPDYDVDRGALFIQHKFALRNHNSAKVIYPHFTTATDTSNIQVVFQVVMDTVICENLHQVTLL